MKSSKMPFERLFEITYKTPSETLFGEPFKIQFEILSDSPSQTHSEMRMHRIS